MDSSMNSSQVQHYHNSCRASITIEQEISIPNDWPVNPTSSYRQFEYDSAFLSLPSNDSMSGFVETKSTATPSKMHKAAMHTCPFKCGKTFSRATDMKRHISHMHPACDLPDAKLAHGPLNRSTSPSSTTGASDTGSFETRSSSEDSFSLDAAAKVHRDEIMNKITTWVVKWLDSRLALLAFQSQPGKGERRDQQNPSQHPPINKTTQGRSRKKVVNNKDGSGSGNEDENSDHEKSRQPPGYRGGLKQEKKNGLEFACPFFKHNPQKYQQMRNCRCSSQGWPATHRLK